MKTSILITILFSTVLFGCKYDPTQSAEETFTDKTQWIYSDQTYSADGMSLIATQDTVTIDSSSISNGEKTINLSDNSTLKLSANGSDWILLQFSSSTAIGILSPFPGITGDTIIKRTNIPTKVDGKIASGTIIIFIKAIDIPVSVPAGGFACTNYETDFLINDTLKTKTLTYVSGSVGIIQKEYYLTDPNTGKLYLTERRRLIYLK
jgi:hypothetical protein